MKIEKVGDTMNIDTELFTVTQIGSVVKVDIQGLIVEKDVETGVYSINTIEPAKYLTAHALIRAETEGVTVVEPEDNEGWIKWEGGECPVEKGTAVDVKYRDGKVLINLPALTHTRGRDASDVFWWHDNYINDIVFYRLSK